MIELNEVFINEHQAGTSLSKALGEARRSDFSLILSMMSSNVVDQAAFNLPESNTDIPSTSEEQLKAQFGIPSESKLAADSNINAQILSLNTRLHASEHGMSDVRLQNCLSPEPLALYNDPRHIPDEVLHSCGLHAQKRIEAKTERLAQGMDLDPLQILNVLEQLKAA